MSQLISLGNNTSALIPNTDEERRTCLTHIDYLNATGQSNRIEEFSNITGVYAPPLQDPITDRNQLLLPCHTTNTLG